jgi:hypothetical protein
VFKIVEWLPVKWYLDHPLYLPKSSSSMLTLPAPALPNVPPSPPPSLHKISPMPQSAPLPTLFVMEAPYVVKTNCDQQEMVGLFRGYTPSDKVRLYFVDERRPYPFDKGSAAPLNPHSAATKKRGAKTEAPRENIPVRVPPSLRPPKTSLKRLFSMPSRHSPGR